jgi:hypothetical protein
MKKSITICFVLAVLSGCATQPTYSSHPDSPGFFLGLFHGFTILFAFIGSFFTEHTIYAYPNAGWPYNLGYLLGVMSFFGGSGAASR